MKQGEKLQYVGQLLRRTRGTSSYEVVSDLAPYGIKLMLQSASQKRIHDFKIYKDEGGFYTEELDTSMLKHTLYIAAAITIDDGFIVAQKRVKLTIEESQLGVELAQQITISDYGEPSQTSGSIEEGEWEYCIELAQSGSELDMNSWSEADEVSTFVFGTVIKAAKEEVEEEEVEPVELPYDIVIRTQEQFEELIASANWLGACSVAFIGDGGTLEFIKSDGSGIKIPDSVVDIYGFNKATINISNLTVDTTSLAAIYRSVSSRDTSKNGSISNITLKYDGSKGIINCNNLSNINIYAPNGSLSILYGTNINRCRVEVRDSYGTVSGASNTHGFNNCWEIHGCTVDIETSTALSCRAYYAIVGVSECWATIVTAGNAFCYQNSIRVVNCEGGASSSGIKSVVSYDGCSVVVGCTGTATLTGSSTTESTTCYAYSLVGCDNISGFKDRSTSTHGVYKDCTEIGATLEELSTTGDDEYYEVGSPGTDSFTTVRKCANGEMVITMYFQYDALTYGNFPESFIQAPIVTIHPSGCVSYTDDSLLTIVVTRIASTTSGYSFQYNEISNTGHQVCLGYNLVAIGRWK